MENITKQPFFNTKKVVTFQRNIRSQSSFSISSKKPISSSILDQNQSLNFKTLIELYDQAQNKEKSVNSLQSNDYSRRSSSQSKHFIEDHVQREDQQNIQSYQQKERIEVSNLQEWINLKKFGQKNNYEEQIENIINQHEVRQRPDIRTDMMDDIMNPQENKNQLVEKNQQKIKVEKTNEYIPSSLADKNFYKSSDYAKTYITNKNLLNQILQKKMKQYADNEELMSTKKEFEFDSSRYSRSKLDQSGQRFLKQYLEHSPNSNNRLNDTNSQFFGQTMTLKKLLSETDQSNNKDKNKIQQNNYSLNQLQKLTNTEARDFINKFSGLQHFKRDICKSIIDYTAIKDAILNKESEKDKDQQKRGNIRRASSTNSQKLIKLYQPEYPLDKYEKKKNSTQEESDPFLKKEEQEKIQQYQALKEISQIKKNEYLKQKQQYKNNKERIVQLGLQVISINQQIHQAKQSIFDYTSKMEDNLKQLSNNKKQSTKLTRGVRYSSTDHDRGKVSFINEDDQNETLITFSQFNQDCPPSPLKHRQFQKKQKDKKSSQFEEIEDAIEYQKVNLRGLEKKLQESNIMIERLQEEQQNQQKNKKDILFELKKLYQVFIKNPENWRYDNHKISQIRIKWVQNEMYELGQSMTEEYFPNILEPQSKEFLKQILLLQIQDNDLDKKWVQWKNQYQMDPNITQKLEDKSFNNLLDKMKRNISLIRQSNIDITVKRKIDRPQCKETLNKLMIQAQDIMNQDSVIEKREKIESKFINEENEYKRKKNEIKLNVDNLTKQEINRLFTKFPISSESSLKEIKNIFYMILPEFQAKRFSKKYQLLCESSAIQEQKNKKGIDYEELREKIKSSLNKSASLKVVARQKSRRAISKDSTNMIQSVNSTATQPVQDSSYQINKSSDGITKKDSSLLINISQIEKNHLPYLNLFDFYSMKTPQGNYVVV